MNIITPGEIHTSVEELVCCRCPVGLLTLTPGEVSLENSEGSRDPSTKVEGCQSCQVRAKGNRTQNTREEIPLR